MRLPVSAMFPYLLNCCVSELHLCLLCSCHRFFSAAPLTLIIFVSLLCRLSANCVLDSRSSLLRCYLLTALSPACLPCINSCPRSPLLCVCTSWSCSASPQLFLSHSSSCALPVQMGGFRAPLHFKAGWGLGRVRCLVRGHCGQVKPFSSMVGMEMAHVPDPCRMRTSS